MKSTKRELSRIENMTNCGEASAALVRARDGIVKEKPPVERIYLLVISDRKGGDGQSWQTVSVREDELEKLVIGLLKDSRVKGIAIGEGVGKEPRTP